MDTFAALLLEQQRRADRSQRAIALSAGVDPGWYSRLLRGEVAPASRAQIVALATVLGASASETDGLLAAAGYLPVSLESARMDDPALVAVVTVLAAPDLDEADRAAYRQVVVEISRRWVKRGPGTEG